MLGRVGPSFEGNERRKERHDSPIPDADPISTQCLLTWGLKGLSNYLAGLIIILVIGAAYLRPFRGTRTKFSPLISSLVVPKSHEPPSTLTGPLLLETSLILRG